MILYRGALWLNPFIAGLLTLVSWSGVSAASGPRLASLRVETAMLTPSTETIALDNVPAIAERPVLKLDSSGPAVTELQQQLKALGHYKGPIDGQYGDKTQAAVLAFQTQAGLTADGVVGVSTWKHLSTEQAFTEFSAPTALLPLLATLIFESTPVAISIQPRDPVSTPWLLFLMPAIPLAGGGLLYLHRRLMQAYWTRRRKRLNPDPQKTLKLIRRIEYLTLFGLLIVALTAFIVYVSARERLVKPTLGRLEKAALLKEAELAHWFEQQRQAVLQAAEVSQTLSHTAILLSQQNTEPPRLQEAYNGLSNHLARLNIFSSGNPDLSILTNGGIVVFSTDKTREGQYQPLQNTTTYFTRELADQALPNFYTSPISNQLLITFATPLLNPEGQRIGVLAVNLDLAELDEKIRKPIMPDEGKASYLGETGETYLVGKSSPVKSEFVAAEKVRNEAFAEGISSRGIDSAIQGVGGFGLYLNYAKTPVIGVYRWAEKQNLALLLEVSQAEIFRPVRKLTRLVFVGGLISIGLLSLGLNTFRNRLLRSFDNSPSSLDASASKGSSTEPALERGNRE